MRIQRIYILLVACLMLCTKLLGQDLQAKLTINTVKIQSVDGQVMTELEETIRRMLNEQTWSHARFDQKERIDCTIGITLNSMSGQSDYRAEIHITARRPVYNSVYITPIINYRDTKFDFTYILGQTLDYNEMSLTNNVVGVIAFYVNIILGLDFDSFSLYGGTSYFTKAMEIANQAQSLGTKGWEPFDGRSRYDLALAFTEEKSKVFRKLWYNYHRLGLDEMAGNASRGRIRILETLKDLEALQVERPSSVLFTFFADCKLEEFIKVCEKATVEEKKDAKERLKKLFPAKRTLIDTMK